MLYKLYRILLKLKIHSDYMYEPKQMYTWKYTQVI